MSRQAIGLLEANGGRISTLLAVQEHARLRLVGLPVAGSLGDQVRIARTDARLSLAALAALAGVSINTVRAIEAGKGTVTCLIRVVEALVPAARVEPVIEKPRKVFRTVAGKPNFNRDPSDYYATPAPLVRMLLDSEEFDTGASILEPCVGQARVIESVLRDYGFEDVTCFDIQGEGEERRDFFDVTEAYDVVLTNPPFSKHLEWITHAKRIARQKIALLMPLNYATGSRRHDIVWTDTAFPLASVLVFSRGLNFLRDPFATKLGASQLYCAWFVWDRAHSGDPTMRWLDNHVLVERQAA